MHRRFSLWSLLVLLTSPLYADEQPVTFEQHVWPILKAHCFPCHGESDELKGRLDVRLQRLIVQGGESGSALVVGKPQESLILMRIKLGEMPPKGHLAEAEARTIERWITEGAKTLAPEPDDPSLATISVAERAYWAFQPVQIPAVPSVRRADLLRTPSLMRGVEGRQSLDSR